MALLVVMVALGTVTAVAADDLVPVVIDQPAELVMAEKPIVPPKTVAKGVIGEVVIRGFIASAGRVARPPRADKGAPKALVAPAIAAFKASTFKAPRGASNDACGLAWQELSLSYDFRVVDGAYVVDVVALPPGPGVLPAKTIAASRAWHERNASRTANAEMTGVRKDLKVLSRVAPKVTHDLFFDPGPWGFIAMFVVGADGKVSDVMVVDDGQWDGGGMRKRIGDAVVLWAFEPMTIDGVAVARRTCQLIDLPVASR